jgi:hypothetical protein
MDDIGSFPLTLHQDEGGEYEIQITNMSKQIGLGPSLFLLNTKAFMYLFAILSIVNIPIFRCFTEGAG